MTGDNLQVISVSVPDWKREQIIKFWEPGKQLLRCIRKYQYWRERGLLGKLVSSVYLAGYYFWSIVTQAEIGLHCSIGGGLLLPHPNGIVIHPDVVIGPNCLIFQQVTIGTRDGHKPGVPRIGGHVDIGAGAKIIGGITIGDNAKIGANAVVLDDVPANHAAIGVPAHSKPIVGSDDKSNID